MNTSNNAGLQSSGAWVALQRGEAGLLPALVPRSRNDNDLATHPYKSFP